MGDIRVPPTPESPSPHRTQRPYFPQSPLLSEPALQLTWPTSPPLFDATLHRLPHPRGVNDQTPFLCLTTPDNSDDPQELISSLDIEDWHAVLQSVATSQAGAHSDNAIRRQSQSFRLPARHSQAISDRKLLDLTIWGPDNLAEQVCVLMHTLYATIRQHECLDWVTGRRSTDMTGLLRFFDVHDHIAAWVHKSILAYDSMTQQAKALDFWIMVAEVIGHLRFDTRKVNSYSSLMCWCRNVNYFVISIRCARSSCRCPDLLYPHLGLRGRDALKSRPLSRYVMFQTSSVIS